MKRFEILDRNTNPCMIYHSLSITVIVSGFQTYRDFPLYPVGNEDDHIYGYLVHKNYRFYHVGIVYDEQRLKSCIKNSRYLTIPMRFTDKEHAKYYVPRIELIDCDEDGVFVFRKSSIRKALGIKKVSKRVEKDIFCRLSAVLGRLDDDFAHDNVFSANISFQNFVIFQTTGMKTKECCISSAKSIIDGYFNGNHEEIKEIMKKNA